MKNIAGLILGLFLSSTLVLADAVIFSGNDVKALKQNLDLNGQSKVMSGTTDPTQSAVSAPIGSIMLGSTTGKLYKKLDAGSSVNWIPVDSQPVHAGNLLTNNDWEANTNHWTATGLTYTRDTTASNLGSGIGAAKLVFSAASQTLISRAVAIPPGLYGRAGAASCIMKGATTGHFIIPNDGTNDLASATVPVSTTYARTTSNFTFPTSGNIQLKIKSNLTDTVYVDDCYLGDAEGFNTFTQQVASDWTAFTMSVTGVTANPTKGTTSYDQAEYKRIGDSISIKYDYKQTAAGTAGTGMYLFAIPNGWTVDTSKMALDTEAGLRAVVGYGSAANTAVPGPTIQDFKVVLYDSSHLALYNKDAATTVDNPGIGSHIFGYGNTTLLYSFHTIPIPITQLSNTGTVYRADQVANSWSGYHDNTCSWARTNTAYGDPTADASCALVERVNKNFGTVSTSGSVLPAITFTPSRAGTYHVCSHLQLAGSGLAATVAARLWDGTTTIAEMDDTQQVATDAGQVALCGLYVATSTSAVTLSIQTKASTGSATLAAAGTSASALEWEIFQVDQNLPAPLLVNSVVSSSSGVESMNRAALAHSADSTCSISTQSGSWLSSVSCSSTGIVTLNLASLYSLAPTCVCSAVSTSSEQCFIRSASTSTVVVETATDGAGVNDSINVLCMGPK